MDDTRLDWSGLDIPEAGPIHSAYAGIAHYMNTHRDAWHDGAYGAPNAWDVHDFALEQIEKLQRNIPPELPEHAEVGSILADVREREGDAYGEHKARLQELNPRYPTLPFPPGYAQVELPDGSAYATDPWGRRWSVEKTRTNAGFKLWQELSLSGASDSIEQVAARVRVRVVRIWGDSDGAAGDIETSLDGGPWIADGRYILS